MAQLIESDFKPAWWLVSPHLQTLWPALIRSRLRLDLRIERINLQDGDFIDLAWHDSKGPTVMLLHGLEGSLDSHYATTLLHALSKAGFNTLFMHLRGCSGEPNRLQRSYHSGASDDLREILQILQKKGQLPQAVVGISLGGNLLLKYLGESGHNALLQAAVAVSVPFHLAHAVKRLERGFSQIYGQYLLRKLLNSYRQKCHRLSLSNVEDTTPICSIFEFDDKITAIQNGFSDATDYYSRCSSSSYLKQITIPTLILHALDDPFMQPEDVPNIEDLGPGVSLELSSKGGHVGFVHGNLPWRPKYWLDHRIPTFLKDRLA